jgi:hypothetical protein
MEQIKAENQLQATCFQWAWNNRPETRRLLAYNLNNSPNARVGNMNKALGLITGRADMELLWKGNLHYFEFKFQKGRQSQEQVKFQETVIAHGATYTITRTLEEFQNAIDQITRS